MPDAVPAPNLPQWMQDHINAYLASGGTEGHMYIPTWPGAPKGPIPALLLTTTGRKSGKSYIFPLFYGETDQGHPFIVASKGGAPEHPGWYRNLLANPTVEVQVGTRKFTATARTAGGAERAQLWQRSLTFWPPYAEYQVKAGAREIPVVVLDPA